MISWIQRSFQHHFRLIFALLLVGMVVPFIFTIGSTPGIGRADRTAVTRDFFGHNLASLEDARRIQDDGRMSAQLQLASEATADQIQYYAYQRVAALHMADELHVPPATPAELQDYIRHLRIFAGPDGQFDVSRYDLLRSNLKSDNTVSEADLARVIADDVRAQKIQALLAGPGYVLPGDVNSLVARGDTSWTISTASVDYAGFDPGVTISDADLSKYFSDNMFRYKVAPRVLVDAIVFPTEAYLPQVAPPSDAELRSFYAANPGRFPRAAAPKAPAKADPEADFAAVKDQVRIALVAERAQRAAVKAGSDVAFGLFDGKVARGAALDAFLAKQGLKASSLAPFTLDAGPAELGGSREIADAAFRLNGDRFYSEALPSPSGAVVLILRDTLPARDPSLAEVRDKVRADAFDNQKRMRFVEFGRLLKAGIERRLKAGEPFGKAAGEAAGAVRVVVKDYPAFKLREQPRDIDPVVTGVLDSLGKGSVSDMEATADKGTLVYAADKTTPPLGEATPLYAQTRAQLARAYSGSESAAILGDLVDQELKRGDTTAK
ncbi:MAG TPA: peptidylprolyl isomerase [Opitutaceae bacterium]|nr:peptidylprolyl isomerase [Opitutaceae bacterium]